IVGIAEAELAAPGHVAELVHGAGIGAGAAERREVGDDRVGRIHHRFIALEYPQRYVDGRAIDGIVQRIEACQTMNGAKLNFAPSDLDGIRQENVGTCQIDFHRATGRRGRVLLAQASLAVSVLTSLPSASNTLATMPLASRPARPYIAAGVSW